MKENENYYLVYVHKDEYAEVLHLLDKMRTEKARQQARILAFVVINFFPVASAVIQLMVIPCRLVWLISNNTRAEDWTSFTCDNGIFFSCIKP